MTKIKPRLDRRNLHSPVRPNRRKKPYVYSYEVREACSLLGVSEPYLRQMIAEAHRDAFQY